MAQSQRPIQVIDLRRFKKRVLEHWFAIGASRARDKPHTIKPRVCRRGVACRGPNGTLPELLHIPLHFSSSVDLVERRLTYPHLQNERICATATYIYSTANLCPIITPSISFRRKIFPEEAIAARGPIRTPPFLPEIYGVHHGDPIIQTLGTVTMRENRIVAWPNVFQTRLNAFKLNDATRPGHLKMLTVHLVDPNRRIMSTSMVPCQRRDWWAEEVRRCCALFWRLPREIFNAIVDRVDEDAYPISREEGERMREEFREERDQFREKHTEAMEGYEEWDFWGEPGVGDGDDGHTDS